MQVVKLTLQRPHFNSLMRLSVSLDELPSQQHCSLRIQMWARCPTVQSKIGAGLLKPREWLLAPHTYVLRRCLSHKMSSGCVCSGDCSWSLGSCWNLMLTSSMTAAEAETAFWKLRSKLSFQQELPPDQFVSSRTLSNKTYILKQLHFPTQKAEPVTPPKQKYVRLNKISLFKKKI